jgi:hypothetical protein
VKPSEVQLDLAAGVRARAEGETTADPGAQVLGRLKLACRDPATGGAAPVRTVRPSCALSPEVMADCRRRGAPYPDPHVWEPPPGWSKEHRAEWLRCAKCHEWMPKEKTP